MADLQGQAGQGHSVDAGRGDVQAEVAVAAGAVEVGVLVLVGPAQAEALGFFAQAQAVEDLVLDQEAQDAVDRDTVVNLFQTFHEKKVRF